MFQFESKGRKKLMSKLNSQAGVPFTGGDLPHFFSIQVFKRLIRATCIREGNLLYSVY